MYLFEKLRGSFYNDRTLSDAEKHKGRTLFVYEGITARSILVLTSGAFLAGFAKLLGADDGFNGILGAIPALAGTIQFISPMVFERLKSRKLVVTAMCFMHRILLALMVFIPFVTTNPKLRLYSLAAVYLISYSFVSFLGPAASNWIVSLTDDRERGHYFGKRDSIILAVSTVLTLAVGQVLDMYRGWGIEYNGFIMIAIVVIVLTFINSGILSNIREPLVNVAKELPKISDIIRKPLSDKNFRKVIIICLLWNIGLQIGLSFFSVYMVSGLDLNYSYITTMTTLGAIAAVISARLWGKLADRTNWPFVSKITIGLLAICHLLWFFVCKSNVYLILPICQILGGAAWGGINIALFNLQFAYAPEQGRTMYLGFNAALGGCVGFGVAMIGARIVNVLNGLNYEIAGITIGKMQVVFGLSGMLLFLCAYVVGRLFKDDSLKEQMQIVKALAKNTLSRRRG